MSDSTTQFIQSLLGGKAGFGSSGLDFLNTLAGIGSGATNGQIDPRLYQYYNVSSQGSENPTTVFNPQDNTPLTNSGTIRLNGKDWVQLAGATDNTTIHSRDPSMFQYDPQFGELTPATNLTSGSDWFSNLAPILAAAGIAGPAVFSALGGLGAGTMGPNASYGGMLASNATDVPIGELPYSGLGGGSSIPMGEMGGATAAGGAAASAGGAGTSPLVFAPGMETTGAIDSTLLNSGIPGASSLAGGVTTDLLGGNLGAAGSSLLGSAMSNPLQALGLLQMGSGLLGGRHRATNTSSSSKSQGGVAPTPQARGPWQPNPYTQAQIHQLYGV